MKIATPLHAEYQLDQLAGQFEHWRQTRIHPGERFPQALWNHAVALASVLPPARVAKQLRLRLTALSIASATLYPSNLAQPLGAEDCGESGGARLLRVWRQTSTVVSDQKTAPLRLSRQDA
jgi:hypothetical protein